MTGVEQTVGAVEKVGLEMDVMELLEEMVINAYFTDFTNLFHDNDKYHII